MSICNQLSVSKCRVEIAELYQQHHIHIEIRAIFADWFEGQNWEFNSDDNIPLATELLNQLSSKISTHSQTKDIITQMRFLDYKEKFDTAFQGQPTFFVKTIQFLLNQENKLLEDERRINSSVSQLAAAGKVSVLVIENPDQFLIKLECSVNETKDLVKEICQNREEQFLKLQYFRNELLAYLEQPYGETIQKILERLQEIAFNVHEMVEFLRKEIAGWQAMLQKSLSGALKPDPLNKIQNWFQTTTDIMWKALHITSQLILLNGQLSPSHLQELNIVNNKIAKEVENLVKWSFLVDKQPKQVLKTQTKFQASVRLLVGSKLNPMTFPEVTVYILSEKQCKELHAGKNLSDIDKCGEILNGKCVMECDKETSTMQAEFKNLQLKNIIRQERKSQESVLEVKSALVFSTKLSLGTGMEISCMTVPVVVVVHGNQGPNSEATIIWDNMFSVPNRVPFEVPDEVPWKDMAVALNARWIQTAEHELHTNHLLYLRDRIFSNITSDKNIISPESMIPWSLFCKEPLKGRSFTFWEWYHGALEVVRKHLKEHWKDQHLQFMTRQMAQKKLLERPPGTFLIRFSDGEVGAITIAWRCEVNGKDEVWHLQPWSSKDLTIRSLADRYILQPQQTLYQEKGEKLNFNHPSKCLRISDIAELTHLYPDVPKEKAFGSFLSKEVEREIDSSGYVSSGIMARIIHTPQTNQNSTSIPSYNFSYTPGDLQRDYSTSSFSPFSTQYDDQDMIPEISIESSLELFIKS